MTTIKRQTDNDIGVKSVIKYVNGQPTSVLVFDISSGIECYKDIIEGAVLTLLGELQLETETGIPYLETVFNNTKSIGLWYNSVRKTILDFPFVQSITKFDYDLNRSERILSYEIEIETDEGSITVNS